jgi:CRISPR/Cas system-associated endonuclease/helicase Cas3
VVIDEVHLPLIAGSWREALKRYDVLATLGVLLVMLSSTLPVVDEQQLFAGMRIDLAFAQVLRSSTVRRNI